MADMIPSVAALLPSQQHDHAFPILGGLQLVNVLLGESSDPFIHSSGR